MMVEESEKSIDRRATSLRVTEPANETQDELNHTVSEESIHMRRSFTFPFKSYF